MLEFRDENPIINEILGDLYKPDQILTREVEEIDDNEIRVTFEFPQYEKTIEHVNHISMAQMHEALLEGLLCLIGNAIKNKTIESPVNYETFLNRRLELLFLRENLIFKQIIKANEPAVLTLKIKIVGERTFTRSFYSITVSVDGFMSGETEGLLEIE